MNIALVNQLDNRFTPVLARGLQAAGHAVTVVAPGGLPPSRLDEAVTQADITLSLWADGLAADLAKRRDLRLVTFVRSYEALTPGMMEAIEWRNVAGAIFVAPHVRQLANERYPALRDVPHLTLLDAVDPGEHPFRPREAGGTRLGYLGYLNGKKGIPLLIQCLAAAVALDPRYVLHIAGAFDELRTEAYFRHIVAAAGLTRHVVLHGWQSDIPRFLSEVDYLLNTSPWEACPNAVIEAMAAGVKPLVHHWPGAEALFPAECLFVTVEDFTARLRASEYDSDKYRRVVEERFSVSCQIPVLDDFLRTIAASPRRTAQQATVSVCMIAGAQTEAARRQLDARLGPALESARPWVDEIVVVDTGCGPVARSVLDAIARRCAADGGPQVVVEDQPWTGDFSFHRNHSLSLASGDWTLVLDSDEELVAENAPLLRALNEAPPKTGCFLVDLHNLVQGGQTHLLHARLFRRGAIRYSQRVHNIPEIQGAIEKCDLAILHHGYAETGDTAQARTDRRVTMCERWVAEEPENPSAWTYLAYARLETKETLEQALDAANRALALHEAQGTPAARLPHAAFPLMAAAARLDRPDDVLRGAQICTDAEPLHPDPFYFGALVFARLGRWHDAFNAAGRFLELQARARVRSEIFVGFENMTYSRTQEILRVLGTAMVRLEEGEV
jgi:tetratricopeptide (TPR) repeat protein